jgi:spermidine synthase
MQNIERGSEGLRVGIIGLGTGTLAAYGESSDEFRFYELNPAVVDAAQHYFTFLQDSPASVDIALGDGRISLERELRQAGSRNYDVLVVDAFNSDAIPVHLLTIEALQLYWSHLKPEGVLALHLTNNYLDLVPVASNLGSRIGKEVVLVTTPRDVGFSSTADWVLLLEDAASIAGYAGGDTSASELTLPELDRVWTDDYSNLLGTLRRKPR